MSGLDDVLQRGGDADDVLRAVVEWLVRQECVSWAAICFREHDRLVPGPEAGTAERARRVRRPIVYRGDDVGELAVDGPLAPELLDRVAVAIAPYVLLGWDTGGEAWEP